jgi:hypothetical protein
MRRNYLTTLRTASFAVIPGVVLLLTTACKDGPDATGPLTASQAQLQGTALDRLRSANWDCQQRGPSFISCAPPGIGLPPTPSLGENGRPVYQLAVFGSAHFLRADLYHGQTCAFTGQPFRVPRDHRLLRVFQYLLIARDVGRRPAAQAHFSAPGAPGQPWVIAARGTGGADHAPLRAVRGGQSPLFGRLT